MSSRKKPYQKKPFESNGISSDVSANIYESMIKSNAFRDLTKEQQMLYVICKLQLYAEKKKPIPGEPSFTMSRCKALAYGSYTESNRKGLPRDIAALVDHGLIDCVCDGSNTRSKNIYRLSDRWQMWGKEGYKTPIKFMTRKMRNSQKTVVKNPPDD